MQSPFNNVNSEIATLAAVARNDGVTKVFAFILVGEENGQGKTTK